MTFGDAVDSREEQQRQEVDRTQAERITYRVCDEAEAYLAEVRQAALAGLAQEGIRPGVPQLQLTAVRAGWRADRTSVEHAGKTAPGSATSISPTWECREGAGPSAVGRSGTWFSPAPAPRRDDSATHAADHTPAGPVPAGKRGIAV